jgi:TRAP-type C4-dicarboxylate transport system permease small subunit
LISITGGFLFKEAAGILQGRNMDQEYKLPWFSLAMDNIEKVINFICVGFLFLQVIAINIMVVGRYFFRYVPLGTEEFALFCMVWFSLFSIMLSIRNDSFVKMEFLDMFLSKKRIVYFKFFAAFASFVFSIFLIVYGFDIVKLVGTSRMSSIPISQGWLYLCLPSSGIGLALANATLMAEIIWRQKNAG